MGRVFRAVDPRSGREFAVKTLKEPYASEPLALERLRREAEALRVFSHHAFVAIHHVGRDHIVQDLVVGESLGARLRRTGRFSPAEALPLLFTLAEALDHMHDRGVVHRDLKPENVMLTLDGKVKVTDFGLAHLAWAPLTRSHEMLGSPAYMAPEQITAGEVEPRSDQYALAVVAYEMLTGRAPFRATGVGRLLEIIVREPPPAASESGASLPESIDAVFARALAKDPWDRFISCRAFVRELRAALARPSALRRLVTWVSTAAESLSGRDAASSASGSGRRDRGRGRPRPE
jgi:serine/threonine-protein kinase